MKFISKEFFLFFLIFFSQIENQGIENIPFKKDEKLFIRNRSYSVASTSQNDFFEKNEKIEKEKEKEKNEKIINKNRLNLLSFTKDKEKEMKNLLDENDISASKIITVEKLFSDKNKVKGKII